MSSRRVVITGMGLISPLGNEQSGFWNALVEAKSGVGPITAIPTESLPVSCAGEAHEFSGHISEFGALEGAQKKAIRKGLKVMCREIQMGVAAAQLALQDAKLNFDEIDRERTGVVYGSDYIMTNPAEFEAAVRQCTSEGKGFDFGAWAEQGLPKVTPLWLLKYLPNMPACHVAIYNDLRGPNNSITVREASTNLALGEAFCTIERGHADAIISGATGTRVHPIKSVHVALQEETATEEVEAAKLSRPFDKHRTGMVVAEGAGAFLLEELTSAEKRGAKLLAEVVGFGSSTVIDRRSVAQRDKAIENAVRQALQSAKITPDAVGHIHAHGVSSVQGDREESRAIHRVFGDLATKVPVVALKSATGNMGAGSGAVELIASVMAFQHGTLFPTQNYESPDPECDLNVITNKETDPGDCVLNINVTPQGQAAALVAKRISD